MGQLSLRDVEEILKMFEKETCKSFIREIQGIVMLAYISIML